MTTPNKLSEKLLLDVKMQRSTITTTADLAGLYFDDLLNDLKDDQHKKAFWINIYNAFFQIGRKIKKIDKSNIYTEKFVEIAGHRFSLDDIEHGILRKYRYKFSLGYLPNIFASHLIKQLAVSTIDYRIHFALNCGAESCPPIAFYSVEKIDPQLDMATLSFLEGETDVLENEKEVHISKLFKWYLGDFGGTKGIRKIINEKLNVNIQAYKLVYKKYSWEEKLDNYSD